MPDSPNKSLVTTNSKNTLRLSAVDIIIIVAGTTDPVNTGDGRANSYHTLSKGSDDLDWYWQDNPKLREGLDKLKKKYHDLHIFPFHGWSGDNNRHNREAAGFFLADRLTGTNGQKPFYPKFKNRHVYLHFIGHSHGGNVINEITKRLASTGAVPTSWTVKSITYLSTPFFKKLHQADSGRFHDKFKAINVTNKYDLTQRVIADFSMHQLGSILEAVDTKALLAELDVLKSMNTDVFSEAFNNVTVKDRDPSWGVDLSLEFKPTQGNALYSECIRMIEALQKLIDEAENLVTFLSQEVEYVVTPGLEGKVFNKRRMIDKALANRIKRDLESIKLGITPTLAALKARRTTGIYPVWGFVDDLKVDAFLRPLIDFLAVNANTLECPLTRIIADILAQQVDVFDNTTTSPSAQIKGHPIIDIPVDGKKEKHDKFEQPRAGDPSDLRIRLFDRFAKRLEVIEKNYEGTPSRHNLLDLLFTMVAQHGDMGDWLALMLRINNAVTTMLKYWNTFDFGDNDRGPFERNLEDILIASQNFHTILSSRRFSITVGENTIAIQEPGGEVGSLMHFAQVSHSVSRMDLYEEVRTALEKQIETPTRAEVK